MNHVPLVLGGLAAVAVFTGVACGGDDDGNDLGSAPTIATTPGTARTNTPLSSATAVASASPTQSDSGAEQEVQESIDTLNRASLAGDAEAFLRQVTDQGLARLFFSTRDDQVRADPSIIQTDEPLEPEEITVDGSEAQVTVRFGPPDNGIDAPTALLMRREGNIWKLDDVEVMDGEAPTNARTIDLALQDFAFEFDETQVVKGNALVFETTNEGDQVHEVQLVRIDVDTPLEELLATEGQPEGITLVGFAGLFSPGDEANLVVTQPLQAGRYAMLCFIPDVEDPEMTPHVAKGMLAEFVVE
jgi:uncharacterized cupredoxin-like copper-binding protein